MTMAVSRAIVITAVPFSVGCLQTAVSRNVNICRPTETFCQNGAETDAALKKRKRTNLDHMTEVDKIHRRKLKNREASQNARDRARDGMNLLEKRLYQLKKQKNILKHENSELKKNHTFLENKNIELKQKLLKLEYQNKPENSSTKTIKERNGCERSLEQASFINVPLLKEQDLFHRFLYLMFVLSGEIISSSFPFRLPQLLIPKNVCSFLLNSANPIFLTFMNTLQKCQPVNCLKNLMLLNN